MPLDFKKEYKGCHMPKDQPEPVMVKSARYTAAREGGDPNEGRREYQREVGVLYTVAYAIKMSYRRPYKISGLSEYVVPPLEGFWRQDSVDGVDYSDKSSSNWANVIQLPDPMKKEDFDWAVREVERGKKLDCSPAEYPAIDEELYVQIMCHGAYDEKPTAIARMDGHTAANGCENDLSATHLHHGICLSDPRKTEASRRKIMIRYPVKVGVEEIPRVYIERQEGVRG